MATSGSRDFTLTRNNLIKRAYQYINVYNRNATISNDDNEFAADFLNLLIKQWQAEGLKLWNRREATVFTAYQDQNYSLGLAGDHATNSYVNTTLSAAEASGQTILSVTSSTGMTAADNIGIELDDGTRQWTTIASVDSSTQITVDDALTDAAASGNTLIAYTTKMERPLEVISARWENITENEEIPLQMVRHEEYFEIPTKTTDGISTLFYYDKQLTSGVLYLWPRPDNVNYIINITYHEQLEDMDSSTDNLDFPQEWELAILLNLAYLLANSLGLIQAYPNLKADAEQAKAILSMYNHDEASLLITPNVRGSSRIVRES